MANTDENSWDENAPAASDPVGDGDNEIRILRAAVRNRLEIEHVMPAASGVGGEHLEGSARAYYASADPTDRPDGTAVLGADDEGRLYVDSDDDSMKVYTGSAWTFIQVVNSMISAGAVTGTEINSTFDISAKTVTLPTSQTITTPTIADFTNATHDHTDAAGGDALRTDAITTAMITDSNITPAKVSVSDIPRLKIGTYTGDANATQNITGVGFDPTLVVVLSQSTGALGSYWKTSDMATDFALRVGATTNYTAGEITLITDGFTAGADNLNDDGETYFYVAAIIWA